MTRSREGRTICAATAVIVFSGLAAAPLSSAWAQGSSATCMQGRYQAVEQVRNEDRGQAYDVMVAQSDVAALGAAGLKSIDCRGRFSSLGARAIERDRICKFAYTGNEAVQEQMERALGVHPAILCKSAEQVAGPWGGRKLDLSPDDLELREAPA